MNFPLPPSPEFGDNLGDDIVKMAPNDNGDSHDPTCECGHKPADHHPAQGTDASPPPWQCAYCSCTRAFPAQVATSL